MHEKLPDSFDCFALNVGELDHDEEYHWGPFQGVWSEDAWSVTAPEFGVDVKIGFSPDEDEGYENYGFGYSAGALGGVPISV